MKVTETKLQGCYIIESTVFEDNRGCFYESFNAASFLKHTNQKVNFVQDNESYSTKGVLRGLHYQRGEYAQAKLVRVSEGTVLDIVVDIRKESKTFGEHFSIELSSENKKQLFIPRGFAHGFIVLSESATFFYKCDNYYNKESEGGIIYNDTLLQIDWKLEASEVVISEKDTQLPTFENCLL